MLTWVCKPTRERLVLEAIYMPQMTAWSSHLKIHVYLPQKNATQLFALKSFVIIKIDNMKENVQLTFFIWTKSNSVAAGLELQVLWTPVQNIIEVNILQHSLTKNYDLEQW